MIESIPQTDPAPVTTPAQQQSTPLLEVNALSKRYVIHGGAWQRLMRRPQEVLHAVDNVSMQIAQGEILGLVGESGSGKTTLGRCLLRLIQPSAGQVLYQGQDILTLPSPRMQSIRRKMQLIFQDPYSSLNPRMTVRQTLSEVLTVHRLYAPAQVDARIEELLHMVGLPADAMQRYPRHFSGGQRQRIGIARALAVEPEFIVADEPVSAVDVSIQAQVLNLLKDLKAAARADHALHCPRSQCGAVHQHTRRRDVSGQNRGDRAAQAVVCTPAPSLHTRAAACRATARPAASLDARRDRRRAAFSAAPATWLPLSHTLLAGQRALPPRRAFAAGYWQWSPGRLSPSRPGVVASRAGG